MNVMVSMDAKLTCGRYRQRQRPQSTLLCARPATALHVRGDGHASARIAPTQPANRGGDAWRAIRFGLSRLNAAPAEVSLADLRHVNN